MLPLNLPFEITVTCAINTMVVICIFQVLSAHSCIWNNLTHRKVNDKMVARLRLMWGPVGILLGLIAFHGSLHRLAAFPSCQESYCPGGVLSMADARSLSGEAATYMYQSSLHFHIIHQWNIMLTMFDLCRVHTRAFGICSFWPTLVGSFSPSRLPQSLLASCS